MSVMTHAQYSSMGDKVGDWDSGKKGLENVDFVAKAFESFDKDKSGFIDPLELRAALVMLGVNPTMEALQDMGIQDKDGDGQLSLADIDTDGDMKIDFEEFKCLAAVLPKRDHAIYKGALQSKPITLPRDTTRTSETQRTAHEAQQKTKEALNGALKRLRTKMKLESDKKVLKDSVLTKKFQELDTTGDGRVDMKELSNYLMAETPDLTKREAWLIMNCADSNNDKVMTFDEVRAAARPAWTQPARVRTHICRVALRRCTPRGARANGDTVLKPLRLRALHPCVCRPCCGSSRG